MPMFRKAWPWFSRGQSLRWHYWCFPPPARPGYCCEGDSMKNYFRAVLVCAALAYPALAQDLPLHFEMNSKILTPPPGMQTIGDSHGDIAVSPAGEIYVSVQAGTHPGIQVYGADGRYLRNVPDAPTDLHGFIIARGTDR